MTEATEATGATEATAATGPGVPGDRGDPGGAPGPSGRTKLVLLDGYSLAFRAFYALPADLATPSGTYTNAVYGFTSMLVKLFGDEHPDAIGVVFDAPGGSASRQAVDPQYKANRTETPELFSAQVPLIHEVLGALTIPTIQVPGVEADDVIATLADRLAGDDVDVIVVTGDRDSYQLVRDPHIKVLYNRRGVSDYALYDEAGIVERTGVHPTQYLDYAALRGDPSDNLGGVPGIGEKTAAKLITTYGDLDSVFANLDALPPKQRASLAEGQERVLRNRELMRLKRDCEVDVDLAGLRMGAWDKEQVRTLFDQLAFRTLFPRLVEALGDTAGPAATPEVTAALAVTPEPASTPAAVTALVSGLVAAGAPYSLEVRWAGRAGKSSVEGLAVATGERAVCVPAGLVTTFRAAAAEAGLFRADGPPLVAHGAKELMRGLPGIDVRSLADDTQVMAYLLDPGGSSYKLEELAERHLGVGLAPAEGDGGAQLGFSFGDDEDGGGEWASDVARRAAAVLQLAPALRRALDAQELTELYVSVELPLVRVLADMEMVGVRVDTDYLSELAADLTKERDALEHRIHAAAGEPFNIGSTQQLQRILFDKLALAPSKRIKTGASTDAASLQKLIGQHPIIEDLLRYREVDKLRSTYALALPPLVEADGRIHAVLNQTATSTGRISSEQPNMQNIPVRSSDGRGFRRAFIPADGCVLLIADYSQIEMRVMAHLADDPGLIDAFERDADIHTATAARVFGVAEDGVTSEHRRFAKVVNYGLAYGMEAYGLSQRAEIEVEEARDILNAYFEGFPRIRAFMEQVVKDARNRGYTTTLLGRRRQLPELSSDNFRVRDMGKRMAQNAPVQGSAADIFKVAMVNLHRALEERGLRSRMILTVHDELVLEVPLDEQDAAAALVREVMEGAFPLRVPLRVDLCFGKTWADAKG
jgi:DNA polymerase-1